MVWAFIHRQPTSRLKSINYILEFDLVGRQAKSKPSLTWKCKMIVQINPKVSLGFPSTMSSDRILTSFTFLQRKKWRAVSMLCSIWNRICPFSLGWNARNLFQLNFPTYSSSDLRVVRQLTPPRGKLSCVHRASLRKGPGCCAAPGKNKKIS